MTTLDHKDALALATLTQEGSNLAACYLDLREKAKASDDALRMVAPEYVDAALRKILED